MRANRIKQLSIAGSIWHLLLAVTCLTSLASQPVLSGPPPQPRSRQSAINNSNPPAFSHDGRYLALVTCASEALAPENELWIFDTVKNAKVDLSGCPVNPTGDLVWSPTGPVFVAGFRKSLDDAVQDWVWNLDTQRGFALRHQLARCARCWKWSPDGHNLATTMATRLGGDDTKAFVMSAVADSTPRVCGTFSCVHWDGFAWATNGTMWISPGNSYRRTGEAEGGVYEVGVGTSRAKKIVDRYVDEIIPSPDQARLALRVHGGPAQHPDELYVFERANGTLTKIASAVANSIPAWRPDGLILAYEWDGIQLWDSGTAVSTKLAGSESIRRPFWHPQKHALWGIKGNRIVEFRDGVCSEIFAPCGPGLEPRRPRLPRH